jgi:hypothetical protein
MPNDIQLDRATTTGGDVLAAKEAADGVKHQRGMLEVAGADGEPIQIDRSNPVPVYYGDSPSLDAYGRLRVTMPETLFDSTTATGGLDPFDTVLAGGGTSTYDSDKAGFDFASASDGDSVLRQSREYIPYQPGKSQQILMSFNFRGVETNVTKRVGQFDLNDGIFFQQDTDLKFIVRSSTSGSAVDTGVAQAAWNIDPLDGTGPSGVTLDTTKVQIFLIDYGWLGTNAIRVGFIINGKVCYVHKFDTANVGILPFMRTPHLPLAFQMVQVGAGSGTMLMLSSTVISEGGRDVAGNTRTYARETVQPVSSTVFTPILSIRPKLLFNSLVNRIPIRPVSLDVGSPSNAQIIWKLIFACTLTGDTWAVDPGVFHAAEVDIAATALSGGIDIISGIVATRSTINFSGFGEFIRRGALGLLPDGTHPTTPTGQLTLAAKAFTGTPDATAAITWKQIEG